MIRLNLLAIGLVSILVLTGCKTAETPPTAESAGQAVTDAAGAAKDKVADTAGAVTDKAKDVAGAAKDKATDAAGAAKDKVAAVAGAVAAPEMANVAGVVSKTKAAIDAGDLEQAKSEMSKFADSWSKVEKGVKAKSPAAFDAIETNANDVRSAVNNEDKAKALTALKALGTAVASAKP
jgi:Domain of unknown function (DUF4363)